MNRLNFRSTNHNKVQYLSYIILFILLNITFEPVIAEKKFTQTGKASYYGDKFHGRPTASGAKYDKRKFTAAHRKLPFGTKLKVTNLNNGKSVIVEVNDRGPFSKGRIIDLSRAAAEKIGMIQAGVISVRIESVAGQPGPTPKSSDPNSSGKVSTGKWALQCGAYSNKTNAQSRKNQVTKILDRSTKLKSSKNGQVTIYRVVVVGYGKKKMAKKDVSRLKNNGIDAYAFKVK